LDAGSTPAISTTPNQLKLNWCGGGIEQHLFIIILQMAGETDPNLTGGEGGES